MHPNRPDVRRSAIAKMRAMGTEPDKAVGPGAPDWSKYSASGTVMKGNKLGYPLGENEPQFDAADNTRMLNKDPKAFRP